MKRKNLGDILWKYIFPILSVILWIATIIFFFKSNSTYDTGDYQSQMEIMNAMRWYPACFIGAIISTVASYVISELLRYIDGQDE